MPSVSYSICNFITNVCDVICFSDGCTDPFSYLFIVIFLPTYEEDIKLVNLLI